MRKPKSLLAAVAMLLASAPAQAAETEWTWQAATSAGEIAYVITKEFTDSIETLTGGRLAVRLVPVGSVVQYNETLDAIGSGLLDGHITATVYFSGKDPAFALLGDLIAAYEHPDQMFMFLRHGGGDALLRELMAPYGVHYIVARRRARKPSSRRYPSMASTISPASSCARRRAWPRIFSSASARPRSTCRRRRFSRRWSVASSMRRTGRPIP